MVTVKAEGTDPLSVRWGVMDRMEMTHVMQVVHVNALFQTHNQPLKTKEFSILILISLNLKLASSVELHFLIFLLHLLLSPTHFSLSLFQSLSLLLNHKHCRKCQMLQFYLVGDVIIECIIGLFIHSPIHSFIIHSILQAPNENICVQEMESSMLYFVK